MFITGELNYREMFEKLNIAIHQFSKRQMTWFRKMEKDGYQISWIDGALSLDKKVEVIINNL
jgi:tRNA dimethylallyltransferase